MVFFWGEPRNGDMATFKNFVLLARGPHSSGKFSGSPIMARLVGRGNGQMEAFRKLDFAAKSSHKRMLCVNSHTCKFTCANHQRKFTCANLQAQVQKCPNHNQRKFTCANAQVQVHMCKSPA